MIGAWGIVSASFFLGIMFPTIFALGLKGLGENTKLGGSMLVMAIVGGAFFRWCWDGLGGARAAWRWRTWCRWCASRALGCTGSAHR